jgi:hypothetical protein
MNATYRIGNGRKMKPRISPSLLPPAKWNQQCEINGRTKKDPLLLSMAEIRHVMKHDIPGFAEADAVNCAACRKHHRLLNVRSTPDEPDARAKKSGSKVDIPQIGRPQSLAAQGIR